MDPQVEPAGRSKKRELLFLAFFVLAAVILTWPIAFSLDQATGIRDDYFSNLWNFWWMKKALFELGASPYWTDFLHYPAGISLGQHTLSPLNSIPGGLLSALVGPHAAFNLVLLTHFALSGWTFFLLARYVTGSTQGSILAGLIYSFCPFHYYYMAQVNVASLEFLSLTVLYFLKTYREGGVRNILLMGLFIGLLTASCAYYLAYAFLVAGLLVCFGKLWDRRTPFLTGVGRMTIAGVLGAVLVLLVAWPLVRSALEGFSSAGGEQPSAFQATRRNDLLGFRWIGPPEVAIVSWPAMLGYSTLLLLVLGWREVVKQKFWLLVGAFFFLLSLGGTLNIAGEDTGIPLPYLFLSELPVFSLLRKPDRSFVMVLFVAALLCASAWKGVATRFENPRWERRIGMAVCVVVMLELTGVPFRRLSYECPPYLAGLQESSQAKSLVHLPPIPGVSFEGRYNYFQTFHEKKMPQGYVTSLALTAEHVKQMNLWLDSYRALSLGKSKPISNRLAKNDIDLVVLHKTAPRVRDPLPIHESFVWSPFFFARHQLVECRQLGRWVDELIPQQTITTQKMTLTKVLGEPVFEDEQILVFETP